MASERTVFVNTSLTLDAREALQRATARLTADTGSRRMSMSAALTALLTVGEEHWDEVIAATKGQPER